MGGDLTDLRVWRAAAGVAAKVAGVATAIRGPGAYAIADQMVRAAESVPANIAEGYGRGFGRDGARFLRTARASAVELESHLRVARAAKRIHPAEAHRLLEKVRAVRAMLGGLVRHFEERGEA